MTGYGESRHQNDRLTATIEIRSVNNRHLKLNLRTSDPFGQFEPEIERTIRNAVRRGSVQITLRAERPRQEEDYRLNLIALRGYAKQLREAGLDATQLQATCSGLLGLPGVVENRRDIVDVPHDDWNLIEQLLNEALSFPAVKADRRPGDGQ